MQASQRWSSCASSTRARFSPFHALWERQRWPGGRGEEQPTCLAARSRPVPDGDEPYDRWTLPVSTAHREGHPEAWTGCEQPVHLLVEGR